MFQSQIDFFVGSLLFVIPDNSVLKISQRVV